MYSEEGVISLIPYEFPCYGHWQSLVWKEVNKEQHCLDVGGEVEGQGGFFGTS